MMIRCENLSAGYGKKIILNSISFSIKKGSFFGIIGPNGSGKTTLFKTLTGELERKTGEIFFEEKNSDSFSRKEKAKTIAIVNQQIETPEMSVEEYVLMGRLPYRKTHHFFESKKDIEIATQYMKLTGVYGMKNKQMNELSGGEQQLAAIARALTQEPELLLLDEPTSHLDIYHQMQILNLIQHLNEEKKISILMIIHDLNLAGEYCDFLLLMNKGTIHKQGLPDEVLTYENIEKVYQTVVITQENPLSKKPAVFLISDKILKNINK